LTAATGIKRLGLAIVVVGVSAFFALTVMSYLIPADKVRDAVKAEIRAATGLDPQVRGATSISLFPTGTVSFANVALGDAAQPALTAERLSARLRFLPLLLGQVEVADLSLVQPTIALTFSADGRSNWSGLIETLARATDPKTAPAASFSEIRIAQGTVIIRDEARAVVERLGDVEMSLAWPSIAKSFGATGRFLWRGEPVEASVSLGDLFAALSGERSGVKLRLTSAPAKIAFDGHLSHRPRLRVEGVLGADGASLRDVIRWAGQTPLPGAGFGRFALKAQTNIVGATIGLQAVNIELDGNSAEGVLTFAGDGRQTLQGTLAAEGLDLSPYVSTLRLLTGSERDWNRVPLALDWLNAFDVDVRLSAARVTMASVKLGRTAIAANLRGGRLTVAVGESQAFDGIIKGSFGVAKAQTGVEMKTQLQFTDVDLEACLGEMFGIRRLEGRGNLNLALEASGNSVLELTRTLNGSTSLTSSKGALTGLNVEQLLRRLERRPLSGGNELRSGRTPFDKLAIAIRIAQGLATAEDIRIDGPSVRLALNGSSSIPARDLDLKGTAILVATASDNTVFELPFVVQGPWDDPIVLPDPQILIRRSTSGTQLLDSLRDRRTRDTVSDAIKRFTGSAAPAATPASEPTPAAAPTGVTAEPKQDEPQ